MPARVLAPPRSVLAASLLAAEARLWLLALPLSFGFFLTGLRQVHNAYHDAIGLSRRPSDLFSMLTSGLMLGSMHAVRTNYLRHHKDPPGPSDVEAANAGLPAWRAGSCSKSHSTSLSISRPSDSPTSSHFAIRSLP